MTIKTIPELNIDFADGQQRTITAEKIRDLLDSVKGVGGILYASGVTLPVTTSWAPTSALDSVRATRGLTYDLPTATFTIPAGSDGMYLVDVSFGVETTVSGWLEIGLSKNGQAPFSKKRRSLTVGNIGAFDISDGEQFAEGDTLTLAIRASGNAPTQVTLIDGTFRAVRG